MKIHSHGVASARMMLQCLIDGCNTSPQVFGYEFKGQNIDPNSREQYPILELKQYISIN